MTRIRPLRGWRYDLAAAGATSLDELLTPPYDVISPAQQQAFYQRHPYNGIRLILGRDEPGDGDHENRYTRAAATLRQWQSLGVLRQETTPAIYLLRQRYRLPDGTAATRTGLIARLRLAPWGQGVLPHERTFPAAKADRLALTVATQTQFSPIFALYSDPDGTVLSPLLAAADRPPEAFYSDDEGVEHTLWAITEPEALRSARAALEPRTFYIADGHHRYETALTYQRWCRGAALPDSPPPAPLTSWAAVPGYLTRPFPASEKPQPFDYVLFYAACLEDPGVTILPTHRCVHHLPDFSADRLLDGLRHHFEVRPVANDAQLLVALQQAGSGSHTYALLLPEGPGYLLRLRRDSAVEAHLHHAGHPAVMATDVAALQALVLGPLLGISNEPSEQKQYLTTLTDAQEAMVGTRAGRFQVAFLLNPTTVEQLRAVAEARQIMPPKATYFYPKLPSGLVIHMIGR